jgi:hypothetical protein
LMTEILRHSLLSSAFSSSFPITCITVGSVLSRSAFHS